MVHVLELKNSPAKWLLPAGLLLFAGGASCSRETALPRATVDSAYAWDGGRSGALLKKDLASSSAAAERALKRAGLTLDNKFAEGQEPTLNAVSISARPAQIRLRSAGAEETEVRVQVGTIGDRSASEYLMDLVVLEAER
jgi:hypothetical protein